MKLTSKKLCEMICEEISRYLNEEKCTPEQIKYLQRLSGSNEDFSNYSKTDASALITWYKSRKNREETAPKPKYKVMTDDQLNEIRNLCKTKVLNTDGIYSTILRIKDRMPYNYAKSVIEVLKNNIDIVQYRLYYSYEQAEEYDMRWRKMMNWLANADAELDKLNQKLYSPS